MLQATVLGKQIYDITGRELDIGLLGLAEFLPAALLVLVTGSVADRFNRKIVGGIAVAFELLCSVALAFYALSKPTAVWPLFEAIPSQVEGVVAVEVNDVHEVVVVSQ